MADAGPPTVALDDFGETGHSWGLASHPKLIRRLRLECLHANLVQLIRLLLVLSLLRCQFLDFDIFAVFAHFLLDLV